MHTLYLFSLVSAFGVVLAEDTQALFHTDGSITTDDPVGLGMDSLLLLDVLNATAPLGSCCAILNATLPGQTHFPDSAAYETQQKMYYSAEQRELKPGCRISPSSASDVSVAIQIASDNRCNFAVASGGHMNWGGSSNMGPDGFTIDLKNLNDISVVVDQGIVSFGSGCTWKGVYDALEPYNLSTPGGRASNVGVGGFLLGGGMSFLSVDQGMGSDNIVNYEVVLADGSISNVNQTSLPDLYWALKYGSTNFGIVIRFDMLTYPLGLMWGGSLYYPIHEARPLLDLLVDTLPKLADDPKGVSAVSLAWSPALQSYAIWAPLIYREPVAFPPMFSPLQSFEPLMSTVRLTNLVGITEEYQATAPSGVRAQWFTLTLKPDAQTMLDISNKGVEIFDSERNRTGFTWAATFAPINAGLTAAGSRNGGNPSGLSAADGDLILYFALAFWNNADDDLVLKAKVQEHLAWAQNTAKERGVLNRFIYMNYALGTQDVMGGLGKENVDKLKKIQKQYSRIPHNP